MKADRGRRLNCEPRKGEWWCGGSLNPSTSMGLPSPTNALRTSSSLNRVKQNAKEKRWSGANRRRRRGVHHAAGEIKRAPA